METQPLKKLYGFKWDELFCPGCLKPLARDELFFTNILGEENSRVQAHIDGDEFSAHILTDESEYNVEVRTPLDQFSVTSLAFIQFVQAVRMWHAELKQMSVNCF